MTDSSDDKASLDDTQAKPTYDELRKRLKVYPSGPTPDKPEPADEMWDMDASHLEGRIRGLYKEMLQDPIPSHMLALVKRLAEKEKGSKS
jgi:hypothetical protein